MPWETPRLSTERARLRSEEGASELLRLGTVLAVGQSELQILVRVHHVLVSLQLTVLHHSRLDDLDRTVTSTVRSSHLLVALLHGTQKGHITVLLVHVVGSRARVVTQPNTEVLHLRSGLVDLSVVIAYYNDITNLISCFLRNTERMSISPFPRFSLLRMFVRVCRVSVATVVLSV